MYAHAAEGLDQFVIARAFDKHRRRYIGATSRVDIRPTIDTVVVEDDHAHWQIVAADSFDFHTGETKSRVTFNSNHGFAGFHGGGDGKTHTDTHDAPSAHVQSLARLVHVDNTACEIQRIRTFIDQHGVRVGLDDVAHHIQRAVKVHRRRIFSQGLGHLGQVLILALGNRTQPLGRGLGKTGTNASQQR